MERVLRKPNIWDLHIHTPLGTPTKKNYGGISSEEFVDKVIELYENATNKIGMISFTDHNKINAEVYKLFRERSNIAVIPGIEIDVYLRDKAKYSKHIIFYFPEEELEDIDGLKDLIESYIRDNEKVYFEEFVLHLIHNRKKFAVSPHAFKQDKRGIDFDWFDEVSADKGKNKFSGLFFPFWEAGGQSDIVKAIEFLEEQYGSEENKQAVIAFSDSADFIKIKKYIDNPYQYFLCLNSFKGLLLAGSDISRIIYNHENRPERNPSEKIKTIVLSNDLNPIADNNKTKIELSDRLNVIVGGRGKGKSALLGAIVAGIDDKKIDERNRRAFFKKFHAQLTNFNNVELASDTKILYFSQSYINKLFDGDSQDKLESFFSTQFAENDNISYSISNIKTILEKTEQLDIVEDLNVVDDLKNIIKIDNRSIYLQLKSRRFNLIELHHDKQGYNEYIKGLLPNDKEIWDEDLEKALQNFVNILLKNIIRTNYRKMMDIQFSKIMKKKIDQKKKKRSDADKKKIDGRSRLEQKMRYLYSKELERIRQVNRLYEITKSMTELQVQYGKYDGEGENKFFFVSISNKEHPVEYAKRMIVDATNKAVYRGLDKKSIAEIFMLYATTDKLVGQTKESIPFEDLVRRISNLSELKTDKIQKIIYKSKTGYVDLHNTSPGTQTNAVMVFILHSESTVPLLIDQPEDNIDNEARYAQLTKWVRQQKYKRQIILVTHDANIVINGDAECVIIADLADGKFRYEYGALEYGNILDKAAIILDGGKTAIHRRIDKYGE